MSTKNEKNGKAIMQFLALVGILVAVATTCFQVYDGVAIGRAIAYGIGSGIVGIGVFFYMIALGS